MKPALIRSVLNREPRTPFFRKLNLWDIRDQVVVGVDLQMSALLELSDLPDILLKDSEEITSYNSGLLKLLHGVPENVTLQFLVQAREGDANHINEFVNYKRDLSEAAL